VGNKLVTIFAPHRDSFIMTINFSLIYQIRDFRLWTNPFTKPTFSFSGICKNCKPWWLARRDYSDLKYRDSYRRTAPLTLTTYTSRPLAVMVCLADNDRKTGVDAVIKLEDGPPQVSYGRNLQTDPRCFPGDWKVLNGMGKKSC
jgi:hypothetical protein